jgi:hypothetical protein
VGKEGKSGKRVVIVMLAIVVGVSLLAWAAASRIERGTTAGRDLGPQPAAATVLSDGVMFEATAGEPGLVIAKDVGSGKELWRAELGAVKTQPSISVDGDLVEIEIAGTPWMTLDRDSGQPVGE